MSDPDQTHAPDRPSNTMGDASAARPPDSEPHRGDPLAPRFTPGDSSEPEISDLIVARTDPDATSLFGEPAHRDSSPDEFPGYDLIEILGEGGMGVVYKARQLGLNRLVALKVILGGRRAGPKDLIRFLAEAESVASIRHPHVVQVHEYGEADGRPFLAMEYLPGGTLAARLKGCPKLDPREAATLVAKLARAVQEAHDQGIVHRDLKPANILFDAQGEPKITDFGLAKRSEGHDLTQTQAIMGTPAYMSPEQARGLSKFVGPPTDIYTLGVILYECLSGTRPFHHEDIHILLRQVIEDEPVRPSRHVPGSPRDLELIALKCLAKDPADRYPSARDLAADLAHFLAGEPIQASAGRIPDRVAKWIRRKPTLAAAYALTAAVLILLMFGSSLAVLWRNAERARAIAVFARQNAEIAEQNAEIARRGEAKARSDVEVAREPGRGRVWPDDAGGLSGVEGQQRQRLTRITGFDPGGPAGLGVETCQQAVA